MRFTKIFIFVLLVSISFLIVPQVFAKWTEEDCTSYRSKNPEGKNYSSDVTYDYQCGWVKSTVSGSAIYSGGGLELPDQSAGSSTEIRGISHEGSLINLIIGWTNFLLPYVNVLSIAAIVAAGLMYILSFTNEELHTKAKSILIYVVIGIVLVYSAFTIVNTLLKVGQ